MESFLDRYRLNYSGRLRVRHHYLDFFGVGLSEDAGPAEPRLLFRILRREHVARVRVFEFDLAALGHGKALGGGSAGPYFRHRFP